MNEKEITTLAREYAEECSKGFAPADMPNCLKNEATDILVCNTEDMLKWLSQRYCLVEKETVRKAFWQLTDKLLSDGDNKSFGAASVVLQFLFPEIAKEVE